MFQRGAVSRAAMPSKNSDLATVRKDLVCLDDETMVGIATANVSTFGTSPRHEPVATVMIVRPSVHRDLENGDWSDSVNRSAAFGYSSGADGPTVKPNSSHAASANSLEIGCVTTSNTFVPVS